VKSMQAPNSSDPRVCEPFFLPRKTDSPR
jgi:hypothetical protein